MFSSTYRGIRIAVSHAAMQELMREGMSIPDVIEILEEGDDAPRKRKKGTVEKWLTKGNKTYNAVIVKDYHELMKEECWLLIHLGKFTKKRP
jgi:hypothetical protein